MSFAQREHFVSVTCQGETCAACGMPAAHKVGEVVPSDHPSLENTKVFPRSTWSTRLSLAAYVCCFHFEALMGPDSGCRST